MHPVRSASLALIVAVGLAAALPAAAQPQAEPKAARPGDQDRPFCEHNDSGLSLIVPADHQALGTVYHALPGRDRQIHFLSDAPFERIEGQSNAVIGYAVAGKDAKESLLAAGEWHLPVEKIRTGNATRDEHMAQPNWLDAASNPNVVFRLKKLEDVVPGKANGSREYTATLVGDMTIKGVTRPIRIPEATIVFLPASAETEKIAKGDLLGIRCKYDVRLSDYGIQNEVITTRKKVAEILNMDTTLYMSTVPPEEQSDGQPREAAGAVEASQ